MLHEPKEKRQISFVDPLFIERENEIAGVGVQKIIRILNPFGNPFQGKNVAKIIVAKKAGEVRLIDFGINSHGASARLNTRGRPAARSGVSHPNAGGQTLEHVSKKLLAFFDSGMLQLLDFEPRPYRSNNSIRSGRA